MFGKKNPTCNTKIILLTKCATGIDEMVDHPVSISLDRDAFTAMMALSKMKCELKIERINNIELQSEVRYIMTEHLDCIFQNFQ